MSAEDYEVLQGIINHDPELLGKTTIEARRRLVDQLILYYQLHVESLKEVKSIRVLRELL